MSSNVMPGEDEEEKKIEKKKKKKRKKGSVCHAKAGALAKHLPAELDIVVAIPDIPEPLSRVEFGKHDGERMASRAEHHEPTSEPGPGPALGNLALYYLGTSRPRKR